MKIIITLLKMGAVAAVVVVLACSEKTPLDDAKDKVPAFIARWGCPGRENGEFYNPYDVAVNERCVIYVVDAYCCWVQYFR